MCNSFYRFCRKVLWLLVLLTAFGILLLNILYNVEVAYDYTEKVLTREYLKPSLLMLGLLGVLVISITFFHDKLECINERKLFRFLCGVYSVFALYLILNVDNVLRADADTVHKAAADLNAGSYYFFQPGEYLYRFHHQHGIVFYEHILLKFSENPAFLFLVNFVLVLGINYTSYKISEELFHDRLTNVLTILVCFAFLPQLFFILFAYGLIPGLFFMLRGFLYTFRFVRDDRWQDMISMAVFVAMAIVVKQNCLIGAIAIIIYLFLQILREKKSAAWQLCWYWLSV